MRRQVFVAALAGLAGCSTSFSVPDDSFITCTSDDECPPSLRCQLTLEVCVSRGVDDDQAPSIESATVLPAVGRSGQLFTVEFVASELLGIDPIVELAIGVPADYPALVLQDRDGNSYTYVYTASGGEPEGDVTLLVRMVDAFGNEASGINLGTVTFDFSAPDFVAPPTVAPSVLGSTTLLTADFTLNGTSFTPPVVELVNLGDSTQRVAMTLNGGSSADPLWAYSLDLATVTDPLADGTYAVQIIAEDLAGNVTSPRLIAGEVTLDRTVPAVEEELGLTYFPDAGNPLAGIGSLRDSATARVAFRASEPLGELPVVTSDCGGSTLMWTSTGGGIGGTFFDFSLTLAPTDTAPDGACSIQVSLSDVAGNNAINIPLAAGLIIDRGLPMASAAIDVSQLKHLRAPWGSEQSPQPGQYVVELALDSATDPTTSTLGPGIIDQANEDLRRVEVYVTSVGGLPISIIEPVDVSVAPASRQWHVPPIPGDFDELWLGALDSSGNRSPDRVRLDNGEWVASLGDKIVGNDVSNPHRFALAGQFSDSPRQSIAIEADAGSGIDVRAGGLLSTEGKSSWRALALPANPQGRGGAATAFDALRGRWVTFGGFSFAACDGDVGTTCSGTWEWDGVNWSQIVPDDPEGDGDPISRTRATMVYDTVRQRVVLFGGRWGNATPANDLWEWDGMAWSQICDTGGQPGACTEQPAPRSAAAMVYDAERDVSVSFGGLGGSLYSDHWEWDGTAWTERCDGVPAGDMCSTPGVRLLHTMAYDAVRQRTVLFGGQADFGGSDIRNEIFEWNGTAWDERCDGSPAQDVCSNEPLPRRNASIGYDRARERIVLFGGNVFVPDDCGTGTNSCDDTWTWNGSDWLQNGPHDPEADGNPAARWAHSMAYDPVGDEIVLFGGTEPSSNYADYADTWVFNGRSWEEHCAGCMPGTTTPDVLARHSMAYSSNLGGIVVFGGEPGPITSCGAGGYDQNLWLWGGATWSLACNGDGSCGDEPGRRHGVALASDDIGQMLFFGGETPVGPSPCAVVSEPILWRNGSYNDVSGGGDPQERQQAALTYDTGRGVWILYGGWDGSSLRENIWEWDGAASWADVTPSENPPWRRASQLTYHPGLGKSVLTFGRTPECGALENCDDVWTWDGTSWEQLGVADVEGDGSPFPRAYHGAVYDEARSRLLTFGGGQRIFNSISSFTFLAGNDLWEFIPGESSRPGHIFSVNMDAIDLQDFSSIRGIEIVWAAAATGGGATADGARLHLWSGGQWLEIDANAEDADGAPDVAWDLRWDSDSDGELSGLAADTFWRRLVSGVDRSEILTAVSPVGSNSSERAEIQTDYVELRVRYSL